MASNVEQPLPDWAQPLSPNKRRIVQAWFEKGSKTSSAGQYDYSAEMFAKCIGADPSNRIYIQHFLDNLYKKYNNNKKGKPFAILAMGRAAVKKAKLGKDWLGVIKAGLEILKSNPWDVQTLRELANACREMHEAAPEMGFSECELAFLRGMLNANEKDPEINKICAEALTRQGQYAQAIACWHRVELARPEDLEPKQAIQELSVKKTIRDGQLDTAESSYQAGKASRRSEMKEKGEAPPELDEPTDPLEQLREAIENEPGNLKNYFRLAEMYSNDQRIDDAEAVLRKALQVSPNNIEAIERLEDVQLGRARQKVEIAQQRHQKKPSPEGEQLLKRLQAELNKLEIDVYRGRCERTPDNLSLKFELGKRLKKAGMYKEAIGVLQLARHDPRHPGEVPLNLGECFHAIKQHRLALRHYEEAVQETPERNPEGRKLAMYRAGKLALGLKDKKTAEHYLEMLAKVDFAYRDVADLLEKVSQITED